LPASIPVFGPYDGRLNPAGDQVTVRRTGGPNADDPTPSRVLADNVHYDTAAPWPGNLNGTGLSLQRRDDAAFGDDPANWTAAAPTPGFALLPASSISLQIELIGQSVVISWPQTSGVWLLESADALVPQTQWQTLSLLPVLQNGHWQAIIPVSSQANRYYRLKTP
jgi:hypothetical protein